MILVYSIMPKWKRFGSRYHKTCKNMQRFIMKKDAICKDVPA